MANIRSARRSGLVLRGGKNRRESLWIGGLEARTTIAGASGAVLLSSLNAAALALRPFTVVRTRGAMYLQSDQTGANEFQAVAYGRAVVSDQASAIGITAVPTPVTDDGSDLWYMYEWLFNDFTFVSGVGFGQAGRFKEIDSRAMRKVEDGQDMVSVVESGANTFGLAVHTFTRTLVKLH